MKINFGFQKKLTWGFTFISVVGLSLSAGFGYYFSAKIVKQMAYDNLVAQVKAVEATVVSTKKEDQDEVKKNLKAYLKPKHLLETGYFYILDSKGDFVLHPTKEGQNSLALTDLDGRFVFKDILEMKSGVIEYHWLNAETKAAQNKIAVFEYFPQWDWYVAASLNQAEVQAPVHTLGMILFLVCFTVMLSSIGFTWWFGSYVVKALMGISTHLQDSSRNVNHRSFELNETASSLSQSSIQQAAALQETASALEEIRTTVSKNLESTHSTIELSAKVSESANQGQAIMTRLEDSVKLISKETTYMQSAMDSSFSEIKKITDIIVEIEKKTQLINDIVFQTKLLSFNASVEAARAGEHGKGFAVVAEEVGRLAAMSGSSAEEIRNALQMSRSKVTAIVDEAQGNVTKIVNSTVGRVHEGVKVASESYASFENILRQVTEVDSAIQQIAQASKEQALGIEEISKAVAQLESTTQSNSTVAQQAAGLSDGLKKDSDLANQGVGELVHFLNPNQKVA